MLVSPTVCRRPLSLDSLSTSRVNSSSRPFTHFRQDTRCIGDLCPLYVKGPRTSCSTRRLMNHFHEKAIWSSHRGGPNMLGRFGCPSPRFHSHSLGRARSSLSRCMVGSVRAGAAFLLTAYLLRKWPGLHAHSPQPQAICSFTPGLSILAFFFSYESVLLSLTPHPFPQAAYSPAR